MYLYGKDQFELVTDHKPLEVIFTPKSKAYARIERWVLRLQSYNFRIVYKPGKSYIADALSRLCVMIPSAKKDEEYINYIIDYSIPVATSLKELMSQSANDPEILTVKDAIYKNIWNKDITVYRAFQNELSFYGNILLRGDKIVIPSTLREKILAAAHEGHPGIVAMKSRLRTKVWGPRIEADAKKIGKSL